MYLTKNEYRKFWKVFLDNAVQAGLLPECDSANIVAENIPIFKECTTPAYGLQEGDYLDGHKEELLRRYSDEGKN